MEFSKDKIFLKADEAKFVPAVEFAPGEVVQELPAIEGLAAADATLTAANRKDQVAHHMFTSSLVRQMTQAETLSYQAKRQRIVGNELGHGCFTRMMNKTD